MYVCMYEEGGGGGGGESYIETVIDRQINKT